MLDLKEFLARRFRRREIFVRTDGRVRYVRLSSSLQVAAFLILTTAAGWGVAATLLMQDRGDVISEQARHIAAIERDRQRLGGELAATRAYYSNATAEMTRQHLELQRLSAIKGTLVSQLISTQTRLTEIEREYRQTNGESEQLNRQLAELQERLRYQTASNKLLKSRIAEAGSALAGATAGARKALSEKRDRERDLSALEASLRNTETLKEAVRQKLDLHKQEMTEIEESREIARTEVRRLNSRVAALNSDLDEAYRSNSSLRRRLAATSDALTETHQHQVMAEQRGQHLARTVNTLEKRLDQVRATQIELLRGIREKAQNNIASLTATLSRTGVPMEELLHATIRRKSGLGGPLLPLEEEIESEDEETFESMVSSLELELLRWESMQTLMQHLPLARPTTRGYISSSFGKRRDPITGRRAMHKGVDIAAPNWTSIFATAGGVVTFAGTKAAYGRIVEVDHGFGFVTRYAHLSKVLVKKGQRVKFHEEIAKMGSSGRSTGSHVHYEVLFEGTQIDPVNFFEAGRYVFKVQDARG